MKTRLYQIRDLISEDFFTQLVNSKTTGKPLSPALYRVIVGFLNDNNCNQDPIDAHTQDLAQLHASGITIDQLPFTPSVAEQEGIVE